MNSNGLEIFDNKLIVLYILDTSSMPLTIDQIAKFCADFDDITYIDICTYIEDLKESKYITEQTEQGNILYLPTELGKNILKELLELIPGVDLYKLKKHINKNMVTVKTDYSVDTNIYPLKNDDYKVSCSIKDGNTELVNITLYCANKDQARNITNIWNENATKLYDRIINMLTQK